MTAWLSDIERRVLWSRRRWWVAAVLTGYLVLALLDTAAYRAFARGGAELAAMEGQDWYRLFRVLGSAWTWVLVGLAAALAGPGREGVVRALRLWGAMGLAGLAAEALKLPFGRLRPVEADGAYVYKGVVERFLHPAHGGPSSHAAVAFGALCLLGFSWPGTMPVMVLAAAGCAATRVVSGAHFLTDVYVGAMVGYACARAVRPGGRRARGGSGLLLP
jgi:hypothetical protein